MSVLSTVSAQVKADKNADIFAIAPDIFAVQLDKTK
jgi:hypothetical protein